MSDLLTAEDGLIPAERQRHLLERVNRDGRVSSAQAAADFGVSEDTIRRDLRELAEDGLVERVHGGALRKSQLPPRFDTRLDLRQAEKARLASQALSFLREGMVVLLDQSTSNLMLARQLPAGRGLTIVTPSPDIAIAALDCGVSDIVLIGGRIDVRSRSAGGAGALEQLGRIRPDICFIGACAIDIAAGVTAADHDDACLKRAMVAASASLVALVTADKLDTSAAYTVVPFARLDHMVTEASIPDAVRQRYDGAEVEIHLV
jgi:DeoR/GlpR family transcriptional regulator of sugar metabolism